MSDEPKFSDTPVGDKLFKDITTGNVSVKEGINQAYQTGAADSQKKEKSDGS